MKFDKEYKNEMDRLSPSEEQIERIKKGVYERIERENAGSVNAPKLNKKPLKIRSAAISGAACACAAALVIIAAGSYVKLRDREINGIDSANHTVNNEGSLYYNMNDTQGVTVAGAASDFTDITDFCGSSGSSAEDKIESAAAETATSGEGIAPGGSSGSLSSNAPQSSTAISSNIPHFAFSDNNELCTVTLNGKTADYVKSEIYESGENAINELNYGTFLSADSGLEEKLLVHFDENHLYVFYESGKLFGYYTAK